MYLEVVLVWPWEDGKAIGYRVLEAPPCVALKQHSFPTPTPTHKRDVTLSSKGKGNSLASFQESVYVKSMKASKMTSSSSRRLIGVP